MIVTGCSAANYSNNYINGFNRDFKKKNADNIVFCGHRLTKTKGANLTEQLSKKMQNRPESVKKLYLYGIDFVNGNLSKEKFIQSMYDLLNNGFEELNDNEGRYVCSYGIAFDLSGTNAKNYTYKSIVDSLDSLLSEV